MAVKTWRIDEFQGIDQSMDGSLCNEGTSADARNMDTSDGNLSVAKGYRKYIETPIPGTGPVRRFRIMPLFNTMIYAAIAEDEEGCMNIYAYDPGGKEWHSVYKYPEEVKGRNWDFLQCNISEYDYMLIACGEHQMVRWDGINEKADLFGSGETMFETTVASYSDKVVTLAAAFDEDVEKALKYKGLVLGEAASAVESVDRANKKVTLKDAPAKTPAAGSKAKVRGGVSDAKVNYLAMHYGRLFTAGDYEHPNRLYYSMLPGDGRHIEDWSSDENNANTSGGIIEIGDSVGDPIVGLAALSTQLLILKRYSVYRLLGDRPGNFTVERVEGQVEKMANTALTLYSDVAFYLTPSGISCFNNITVQPLGDAWNIRGFMEGCYVSLSKACTAKGKLYFSCYKGDEPESREYDNHVIVYDMRRRTYMIRDGFEVADLFVLDGQVYMVNGDRYVYELEKGADYDGKPIRAYWHTQRTDWRARGVDKKIDEVFLCGVCGEGSEKGAALLLTTYYGNRQNVFRVLVKNHAEEMMEIEPLSDWARTFQFKLENEAGSRFTLFGGVEAYVQAKERPR